PGIEISYGRGAELVGRVSVGQNELAQQGFAHLAAPRLSEADEKFLIAREAGRRRRFSAASSRLPVRIGGGVQAREVSDGFAQRQMTVDVEIGKRNVGVVLRHEFGRGGLEMREVFLCPPVAQLTGCVEL